MEKENKKWEISQSEVEILKTRLAEAEETLRAIRSGEVDALVVTTPLFDQVFTLRGAERPYRILMENMKEGAVTLAEDDSIIYCNKGFADMVRTPLEKIIGTRISNFVSPGESSVFEDLLRKGREIGSKGEILLRSTEGKDIPAHISVNSMFLEGSTATYLIAMDITEHKQDEEKLQKAHDELELKVEERTVELKQAERDLFETKQRLQALLEALPVGVSFSDDPNCQHIKGNPAALAQFELSSEDNMSASATDSDVPGRKVRYFRVGRKINGLELPLQRAVAENRVIPPMELEIILPGGRHWFAEASGSPIRDSQGKVTGGVAVTVDITERKQAEEALHRSNQQLDLLSYTAGRLLTSNEPLQIVEELCQRVLTTLGCQVFFNYLVDEEEKCLHLNTSAGVPEEIVNEIEWLDYGEAVCGCAARDGTPIVCANIQDISDPGTETVRSLGINAYACYPLFSRGKVTGTLSFGTGSRQSFTYDELSLIKTISEHVSIALERVISREELERMVEAQTAELKIKIEEQQRAEVQIQKQAELLDKAQDAIALRDLEHRLIYWNKGAERLYGWTAEEVAGRSADRLLYKKETPGLIEAKKSVIEKGEWVGELEQITKNGREIIVEGRWTLIRNSDGKPESILIINTDITEKKKLQSQLLQAQRMESIGTLASGIAHDLNNVLAPIMMSVQMLNEKLPDEQSKILLAILEKNSQRGADLIKQVLSFARGVEGERKPIQIKHIINEIRKIAKETFPKNIEIQTSLSRDLYPVSGDATQLHQVIMNICVNARDAMPDGGLLLMSAANMSITEEYARENNEANIGPYIVISICDNGCGIPPETLDRIFEPFFTTKKFGKGTGLGLSTSLGIVKSHGGFMKVKSEEGKGTTFWIYLPAIEIAAQEKETQPPELHPGNGELILVAEDEESIRQVTVSILEANGYEAITAENGADAVDLYVQHMNRIRAVVMDMMMPIMDGYASIRAIHEIDPCVKVIAVSGLAEKDMIAKIERAHPKAFLPKPYTTEKLLETIHTVINTG